MFKMLKSKYLKFVFHITPIPAGNLNMLLLKCNGARFQVDRLFYCSVKAFGLIKNTF